jgi:hypothetical protein
VKKKPIYKRWWVWAIVVVIIAIIANSQENYDNSSTDNTKPTSSAPKQEAKPVNSSPKTDNQQQQADKDKQEAADLKKYFDDNMAESSWYPLIKTIDISNDNVFIRTSAPVNGKDKIAGMNNAVWGYTNLNGSKYKIKSVTIYAENGHPLLSEDNPKQ